MNIKLTGIRAKVIGIFGTTCLFEFVPQLVAQIVKLSIVRPLIQLKHTGDHL